MIIIMLIIGLIKDNFIPVGSGVRYFILINNGWALKWGSIIEWVGTMFDTI